jgi:NAD(P)H-dependent FMN reductase
MSILVLSCSLNPESNSRLLAEAAVAACVEKGAVTKFADLRHFPLPLCDGADAYSNENVASFSALIEAARGIVIATPIYNYDANAAVKNLVELTGSAWEGKTVAFLCAAGGHSSYMSIMGLANSLMLDFRCVIVPRFVYATNSAFDGAVISDLKMRERIARVVDELIALSSAYHSPSE